MKKVFCFGTFDGIHDGHRHMLRAARELGDYVIVAVTQDNVIEKLKGKNPRLTLAQRLQNLKQENIAHEVVPGDMEILTWGVLQSYEPAIVALGYDQVRLKDALTDAASTFSFSTHIVLLPSLRPDELHSSLLFARE